MMPRGRFLHLIAVVVALAGATALGVSAGHAATAGDTASRPPFSGSAAAGGVRATLAVPEAPVTNTPVDGGGPTAQVQVDSLGTSTGYAAFPDPGQLVVSIPGLAVGLLSGGPGGVPIPSPPPYPFAVSSDPTSNPEAS